MERVSDRCNRTYGHQDWHDSTKGPKKTSLNLDMIFLRELTDYWMDKRV